MPSLREELAEAISTKDRRWPAWEKLRAEMKPDEFRELTEIINDRDNLASPTAIVRILQARGIYTPRSTVEKWVDQGVPA